MKAEGGRMKQNRTRMRASTLHPSSLILHPCCSAFILPTSSLHYIQVIHSGGEVAVLRFLAVQLDLQSQFVHRVGVAYRVLVADFSALIEVEQRLVEGLHAQFPRLFHDLLDLVHFALEYQ